MADFSAKTHHLILEVYQAKERDQRRCDGAIAEITACRKGIIDIAAN